MVPTFTTHRFAEEVPDFAPAASPTVRRSLSRRPPHRRIHIGFGVDRTRATGHGHALHSGPHPPGSSRYIAYGALHRRFLAYTFPHRLPDPARLAVPGRPVVVRTASRPHRRLPDQTVLSFPGRLRPAEGRALPSLPGYVAPRGARTLR